MSPARSPIAAAFIAAVALAAPAAAAAKDVNHDGLPDRWERAHRLALSVNQANRDQDRDGLVNRLEFADRTDPRRADTDRDGIKDGQEDADRDGVSNRDDGHPGRDDAPRPAAPVQTTTDGADGGSATSSGEPASPLSPPDHVVSLAEGVLTLARADGTTVSAPFPPGTDVECGVQLPGPFHPCGAEQLVPGAKVGGAVRASRDAGAPWSHVFLVGISAPAPTPAPAPPTSVPAPPVTGSVASFAAGVLTVTRPSGEHPAGPLAATATVRCLTIAGGAVVSAVACDPASALVPGAQLGMSKREPVGGVWSWTVIDVLLPGGGADH